MEESSFYKIIVQETSYGDFNESSGTFGNLPEAKDFVREMVKQYLELEDDKLLRVKIIVNKEDYGDVLEALSYISLDFYEGWHKNEG